MYDVEVGPLTLIKESGQTINSYLMRGHLGDIYNGDMFPNYFLINPNLWEFYVSFISTNQLTNSYLRISHASITSVVDHMLCGLEVQPLTSK